MKATAVVVEVVAAVGAVADVVEDVVLTDERDTLYGKVTICRRLAGTRIAEIDIANNGHEPYHLEIEVPLDASVAVGAELRFRPTRWKIFRK